MPVHRVARARIHEDVIDIEHQGERIVAVVPDGDRSTHVLIFTDYIRPAIETRGGAA
jgi:hypothetical protein